jgi:hypothetical protein
MLGCGCLHSYNVSLWQIGLGYFQKALPALPISIALGAVFVLTTSTLVTPLLIILQENLVMM